MGKLIGALALAALVFAGALALAGDLGGEVVVLTTYSKGGTPQQTKLWVVDDNRQVWLRAGQSDTEWFRRIGANPMVTLERDGRATEYRAVAIPKQRDRINRLMAERYGWADWLIGLVRDFSDTQPVRLDPIH
jgi:hypothetical protein